MTSDVSKRSKGAGRSGGRRGRETDFEVVLDDVLLGRKFPVQPEQLLLLLRHRLRPRTTSQSISIWLPEQERGVPEDKRVAKGGERTLMSTLFLCSGLSDILPDVLLLEKTGLGRREGRLKGCRQAPCRRSDAALVPVPRSGSRQRFARVDSRSVVASVEVRAALMVSVRR